MKGFWFSDQPDKAMKPRVRKKRKKVMMILVATIIVGLFFGGTLIISSHDGALLPTTIVKRGPVTIKITEAGELRAQDQVTISAANDKMILWMAPEGSWVEEGDTLVVFESEKYVIARSEAKSSVDVAKAEMNKAFGDLEAQKAKEEGARQNYESLAKLAEKGYVMESEVEQARLAYVELKSKTKSFMAAVEVARANVVRAQRGMAQQDRKLRENIMLAPRAGLVVYATMGEGESLKKISLGMTPFQGQELMYLPDISSIMVDAEISEVDLAKVKVGLPAEIRLDAYPDAVFTGEIKTIADLAKRKISRITGKPTGAKVFDITIHVLDHDVRLKPGLTANVDIIVSQYGDALYVPLETIFLDEQDQTVVYVKNNRGQIESRLVVLGESNDRVAVVKEGLQADEKVCLVRPAAEQLTRETSATWFTSLKKNLFGYFFKSTPRGAPASNSPMAAGWVKPGLDFKLTHLNSLPADSVAIALDFNFAISDSLAADSVKRISSLR
jgi:HlyD family secretion protein